LHVGGKYPVFKFKFEFKFKFTVRQGTEQRGALGGEERFVFG
jgi:hypothetical protein